MKAIELKDVSNIADYEKVRREFRRRILEIKQLRRVPVGDKITLLFENRDTVLLQIQEMMRIERIVHEDAIRHEIDTYNELIPRENELVATMFIEVQDSAQVRDVLDSFAGLPCGCVFLDIDGSRIEAVFDLDRSDESRVSAVQYLRFAMSEQQADSFRNAALPASIVIDQPNYRQTAHLTGGTRMQLAGDLES